MARLLSAYYLGSEILFTAFGKIHTQVSNTPWYIGVLDRAEILSAPLDSAVPQNQFCNGR